jgi:glycosyltransferase involved in cell wall biosynthesis
METASTTSTQPTLSTNAPSATRKIRVLHLIYSPGYGGIESAVIHWVKNLDPARFEVFVAYFAGDRDREIPFLRAAHAAGLDPIPVPWTKFKPFLRCAREVARVARERNIDILHTHAYYGDAVGAIAGKLAPVKTVATVYVWGKYELHRQLMQLIDWISIQFMTKVTAHCQDTANKTYVIGKRRSQIPILLPGYPLAGPLQDNGTTRSAARQALGIADDEVLLLNAARLAPEKAQDQLLKSFRLILDECPKARLWISGVGLPDIEANLRELIVSLKLEGAAQLIGFRENYREMLRLADVMVHPTHVEGMPLALLGAMEAGLPIVASRIGGIPELIDPGKTGYMVEENDWQGFAKAVIPLVKDAALRRRQGEAAQTRVATSLSMATAIRKVEEVYFEMVRT